MVHLTNDAIQKKSEEYGKFEGGNKVVLLIQGILQRVWEVSRVKLPAYRFSDGHWEQDARNRRPGNPVSLRLDRPPSPRQ